MMMPKMNGSQLIEKIRKTSNSQRILILSGVEDLNEMRDVINLGIDGILLKPYKEDNVLPILRRILSMIKAKKTLKKQLIQLRLLSKANIELKISNSNTDKDTKEELVSDTEVKLANESLKSKYHIREYIKTKSNQTKDFFEDIEQEDILEDVDKIIYDIESFESSIIKLESKSLEEIKEGLMRSLPVFESLITIMDKLHIFDVANESASNLIRYIESIDINKFEDSVKKRFFFDVYLSLFQDIYQWINMIFIKKDRENINYFDASFANSCLELESIFTDKIEDDDDEDDLEFF